MMNPVRTVLSLALTSALLTTSPTTWATPKKPNTSTAKSAVSTSEAAVRDTATAQSLVRYGDANKDPVALLTAARILKTLGSQPSSAKREGAPSGQTKPSSDKYQVDSVLARARALSAGRPDLLALADDIVNTGSHGATNGVQRWNEVVRSQAIDVYRVTFRGGEPALFAVSGDGESDLDLYVYDENGNLICKDDDYSDDMACRWTPAWTGTFIVKIRNMGVANAYTAAHN